MADMLKGIFGGSKAASSSPIPTVEDADFADFAGAPEPSPASIIPSVVPSPPPAFSTGQPSITYTKWYRVWERTSPSDFYQEMFIIPVLLVMVLLHKWGTRANRRRAHAWVSAHAPVLQSEFASVGFGGVKPPSADSVEAEGLLKSTVKANDLAVTEDLLKERTANEYYTYATGRQNIAFVDFKISLLKRYNPLSRFGEAALAFLFESMPAPVERVEATAYVFDGKEADLVPMPRGAAGERAAEQRKNVPNSSYDGFVWAIVHKDLMKRLRDERYDISLTTTKDHPKLPHWATVMSESAEITESLLNPELIKAVEQAGEALEALVISDQPVDRPTKLEETIPKKRVTLSLKLPAGGDSPEAYGPTLPLVQAFLRLPDTLVGIRHWRPEAMRRVRQTREEEARKLRKAEEEERAEERRVQAEKEKRERREQQLKGLGPEAQRKFLEKEREKERRKGEKRRVMKA